MNANVRASVREGRGGDVSRVWEWIGSVSAIEDAWAASGRRDSGRYSLGPAVSPPIAPEDGCQELVSQGKWEESRPIY